MTTYTSIRFKCSKRPTTNMPLKELTCPTCGKPFKTYHKHQRFCSIDCYNKFLKSTRITKICPVCKKEFVVRPCHSWRKFCSMKCYGEAQRLRLTNHPEKKVERIPIKCKQCGKNFQVLPSRAKKRKFCSLECYYAWRVGHPTHYPKDVHVNLKYKGQRSNQSTMLRKRNKTTCEICGFSRLVQTCHIVPMSKGGTYDNFNILFLCPNHHRLFDRRELSEDEYSKIADKVEYAKQRFKHG